MRAKPGKLLKLIPRVSRTPTRIAIVGTQATGKTVFLTSLIDHFVNHEQEFMDLGPGVEIQKCTPLHVSKTFPAFPHELHRSTLVDKSVWPMKTRDRSIYRCSLSIKQGKKTRTEDLELMDFPGERGADFPMYSRSYEDWSELMLTRIRCDHRLTEMARSFFTALDANAPDEEILQAYKEFLSRSIMEVYSRLVSPSLFLLDEKGSRPSVASRDTWPNERWSGRNEQEQFIPLPFELRSARKATLARFKKYYRAYQKNVVDPLVTWIKEADQMYLMVDIPQILMGKFSMYNDEKAIARSILEVCDREPGRLDPFEDAVTWLLGGRAHIKKLGIIATKADLVATEDDMDNMEALAKRMLNKHVKGMNVPSKEYFVCSAVKSTRPVPAGLQGRLVRSVDGTRIPQSESFLSDYSVSSVPQEWPKDKDWNGFSFPEVYPEVSAKQDVPPTQLGLDNIVKYMLDI